MSKVHVPDVFCLIRMICYNVNLALNGLITLAQKMSVVELSKYLSSSRKWKCHNCFLNDMSEQDLIKSLDWLNNS